MSPMLHKPNKQLFWCEYGMLDRKSFDAELATLPIRAACADLEAIPADGNVFFHQ